MIPQDTIVATATPPGESAIGVVRLSGPDSFSILKRIFVCSNAREDLEPRHAHHGWIRHPETHRRVDEVLIVPFPAPNSYTGENVVEISAHGSMAALRAITEVALRQGARMAEPGEFTRRAFLNGKLSLDEAEAVIDVIKSHSEAGLRVASEHLSGSLSRKIEEMRQALMLLMAHVEATLDFPEDEIDAMSSSDLCGSVAALRLELGQLLSTYEHGRILREGLRVALVGPPNAGKSSLLNALLRYERALVTPIPGTTRDTVEEPLILRGLPVRAIDTAGLRLTEDPIELLGMDRSRKMIAEADIVVLVLDISEALEESLRELIERETSTARRLLHCFNKADLPRQLLFAPRVSSPVITVTTSAITGEGIAHLEQAICEALHGGEPALGDENLLVTRLRHKELLDKAAEAMTRAVDAMSLSIPLDCIAIDLREAYAALGRIMGQDATEDLLDKIFSEFCIGK